MRITPLEIRKHPFRKTMRGFDPDQVGSFLDMVAHEFETIFSQNNEMQTQLKSLEQKLQGYEKIERTLNDTLLTAQKATDDARYNAQKEAELIIQDAQVRIARYEDESRRRVHELESELVALRNQRDSFLARFRSMLSTQLDLLGIISNDLRGEKADAPGAEKKDLSDEEKIDEALFRTNNGPLDS